MGIRKEDWKAIILYGIIAGTFGIVQVFPFVLIYKLNIIEYFSKSFLMGMTLGCLCPFVFEIAYRNVRKYTFWAFFSIFIFIGLGTTGGVLLMGLENVSQIIMVVSVSEVFGMVITAISHRKACDLNAKLLKAQEKLEKKVYHHSN